MAETKKVTPEESVNAILSTKKEIVELLSNDFLKKVVEYAPMILSYAEKYAMSSETEVDDRAVVIAEAIALILKGGIDKVLEEWKK